jgi:SAM-dependent methyltransferase
MGLAQRIDEALHRSLGLAYLRLARERAIHERCEYARAAFAALDLKRPRVLDVGCGSGLLLRHLARYPHGVAQYTGIDRHASRLESRYSDVTIPHRFCDIDLDSDWRAEMHDVAWCSEVLEHLIDDKGVLARIARAVKPGGAIVVTMPSLSFLERISKGPMPEALNVSATQDGWHVRAGYTPETISALAASCGLGTEHVDAISPRLDFEIVSRYRAKAPLWQAIDRIKFARQPDFVIGADAQTLAHYFSIAAVLRRP